MNSGVERGIYGKGNETRIESSAMHGPLLGVTPCRLHAPATRLKLRGRRWTEQVFLTSQALLLCSAHIQWTQYKTRMHAGEGKKIENRGLTETSIKTQLKSYIHVGLHFVWIQCTSILQSTSIHIDWS